MGNEGIILAVIGIAAVGAYVLNLGGIKDKINELLKPSNFVPHGDIGPAPKGIAVGEFNPATAGVGKPPQQLLSLGPVASVSGKGCPPGYTKAWGMNEGTKWAYCNKGKTLPAGLHAL